MAMIGLTACFLFHLFDIRLYNFNFAFRPVALIDQFLLLPRDIITFAFVFSLSDEQRLFHSQGIQLLAGQLQILWSMVLYPIDSRFCNMSDCSRTAL